MMLRDQLKGHYKLVENIGVTNIRATYKQNHNNMAQNRESECFEDVSSQL